MKDREYAAFLLLNAPGFGAKSIYYVYEKLQQSGLAVAELFDKSLSQLENLLPDLGRGKYSKASLSSLQTLDDTKLYSSYQKLKHENIHIVGLDDERYPIMLLERLGENTPPVLFCKGSLNLMKNQSISIVGSRDVNDFGMMITKRIANRLATAGYNVTSGFAKGVDTCAHIGALEEGGTTVMVLSYGFNYLSIKKELKQYHLENNTLFISQFMPYEKFSGQNAMIRNKLVCALSKAVIVISSGPERDISGKMSGTFDAGLTSIKYHIPLYVLNPSLFNPPPKGNIDLIKMGGIPLSNGTDLVQYLGSADNVLLEPAALQNNSQSDQEKEQLQPINVGEPEPTYQAELTAQDDVKDKILGVLNGQKMSITQIKKQAHLDWNRNKLQSYLEKLNEIEVVKKGQNTYYQKKNKLPQTSLF